MLPSPNTWPPGSRRAIPWPWPGQVVASVQFYGKFRRQPSPVGPATERVLAGFRREGRARGRGRWWASGGSRRTPRLRVAGIWRVRPGATGRRPSRHHVGRPAPGLRSRRARGSRSRSRGREHPDDPPLEDRPGGRGHGPVHGRTDGGTGSGRDWTLPGSPAGRCSSASTHRPLVTGRRAQSFAVAGASIIEIQTPGRWQSPSILDRYARGQLAARRAVAKLRYGA